MSQFDGEVVDWQHPAVARPLMDGQGVVGRSPSGEDVVQGAGASPRHGRRLGMPRAVIGCRI